MCIASMVYGVVQVCVLNLGLLCLLDWQTAPHKLFLSALMCVLRCIAHRQRVF